MEEDSNEESYDPNDPVWKYCQVVYPRDINDSDLEPLQKKPRLEGPTDEARTKELWEKACICLSQWFFEAGIPFSAISSPSFQKLVDAIGEFGPGAIGPTHEELAGPLLNKAVDDVERKYVNPCKEEWAVHGCTLMVDSWRGEDDSGERERTFLNFLVNSPRGSVYIQSVDASDYGDNGQKLFEVIDRFVEDVGESKVVQVITDNFRAMTLAGTLLETKRPNLYWTSCVSRCLYSILEDISKIPSFEALLKRVESVISYIYTRPRVVNMLRQLTGQQDLVRPGITTIATACLTLERVLLLRRKLCYMVISQEWEESKWFKEARGEMVTKTILSTRFWDNVEKMLKIYRPLIRVWRLVDGEKRRNRLAQRCWKKRLYVKYNQALKLRYKGCDRLYAMKDIDDHDNEWLVGNMHELSDLGESVFEGRELTWDTVATSMGEADELGLKITKSKEIEEVGENENEKEKENASPSFSSFLRLKGGQDDEEKVNEKYECMIDEVDEDEDENEDDDDDKGGDDENDDE